MTRLRVLASLWLALALCSLSLPSATAVEQQARLQAPDSPVTVELDQTEVQAGPGEKIHFTSTVRNTGTEELRDLVANVAILTSDPGVYVDPEDWSAKRTQFVDRLDAGDETTLEWDVQAVTAGPLILYVAVTDPGSDSVAVSGPLFMDVSGKREVKSQDAFPLVTGIPAAMLLLLVLTGVRRRLRR